MGALRIAILADDVSALQPWEKRLIGKIYSDDRLELVGIAVDGRPPKDRPSTRMSALFSLLARVEDRLFVTAHPDSFEDFEAGLAKVPIVRLMPLGSGHSSPFPDRDVETLRQLKPDVILQHGFADTAAAFAGAARFGLWRLEHAGGGLQRDLAAGFREALRRKPVTTVALRQITPGTPDGRIVSRGHYSTNRLAARNRTQASEKAVSQVWLALNRIAETGCVPATEIAAPVSRTYANPPSLGECLSNVARTGMAIGDAAFTRLARMTGRRPLMWSLFFGDMPFETADLSQCREAAPGSGEFWADPFLLEHDGATYVFFENYVYATGRGKISVARLDAKGLTVIGDALDRPYHLSYPLVFRHGAGIFMVPETLGADQVEVWRAVDFPLRWELHATALEGRSAADTVLFEDAGQWWMFSNISEGLVEDHCNELHVFQIDGPDLKRVTPHPLNPVVIDSRTARNGGRIARRDGRLIRPSQNNSYGVYGWGLNLMEITRLDMEGYDERCIKSIEPGFKPGIIACHHVDMAGDVFVIDGCRKLG